MCVLGMLVHLSPPFVAQAALQEFAWTEASLPERLKERLALQLHGHRLEREPMFCLETAMKLQKWSKLAYTKLGQEAFREQRSQSVAGSPDPDRDPEKAEASFCSVCAQSGPLQREFSGTARAPARVQ